MKAKKVPVTMPEYLTDFECLKGDCADSCCAGWNIPIDKTTYKKYIDLQNLGQISKDISLKVAKSNDRMHYATLYLKDGKCPFNDEAGLCELQVRYGNKHLSSFCKSFPRVNKMVNGSIEQSASLSCIAVAKLALGNPEPMKFKTVEEVLNADALKIMPNTQFNPDDFFAAVRLLTMKLVQCRDFSLNDRMILLGMFCKDGQDILLNEGIEGDERINQIKSLIRVFLEMMESKKTLQVQFANMSATDKNNLRMQFIQNYLINKINNGKDLSEKYVRFLNQWIEGMDYNRATEMPALVEKYGENYNRYYTQAMDSNAYILENYLAHSLFKNLIPMNGGLNFFDSYKELALNYSLLKFLLVGISGYYKEEFSIDTVIEFIQSYTRVNEQNQQIADSLKTIADNGNIDMTYFALLLTDHEIKDDVSASV